MNNKENNIIYSASDIEQYLTGKLTPVQMHAMEKAALDDALLAEAIEGYGIIKEAEWKDQLAALKDGFKNNKRTAKVIPLANRNSWWKFAAAVVLFGSTATISYLLINKKEKQQIAQTLKTEPAADSFTSKITTQQTASANQPIAPTDLKAEKKNNVSGNRDIAAATETIQPDSNFIYKPGTRTAAPSAKKYTTETLDDFAKGNTTPVTTNAATSPVYNNTNEASNNQAEAEKIFYQRKENVQDKKDQQLTRNFTAQVVGPDNTPLPFANISVKNENFGTYADAKGNFRLVSPDSLLIVEVKAAGYQSKLYTLQSGIVQQNKITLAEEDFASRQKTVVGYGTVTKNKLSKRATLLKDSVVNVEPADGWDNYNAYINNNIEIPDDILDKNLHGQVELSFDVKPNGTITNIKVDKSLCDNCDEAAKRLIQQGPQWKIKNGKRGKGKVTVQF